MLSPAVVGANLVGTLFVAARNGAAGPLPPCSRGSRKGIQFGRRPDTVRNENGADVWMGSIAGDERKEFSHETESRTLEDHHLCGYGGRCSIGPIVRPDAAGERLHRPGRWRSGWCRGWHDLGAAEQTGRNRLTDEAQKPARHTRQPASTILRTGFLAVNARWQSSSWARPDSSLRSYSRRENAGKLEDSLHSLCGGESSQILPQVGRNLREDVGDYGLSGVPCAPEVPGVGVGGTSIKSSRVYSTKSWTEYSLTRT
jgi:hypothetical protein